MDNKEAIKILRKGYPDINRYAPSELEAYDYDVATYDEAVVYAISHLEAERWNSICTEADLPKKEGKCLVFTDYGDVTMDSFVDGMFVCNLGNVTHWKPLPKAPESEDKQHE